MHPRKNITISWKSLSWKVLIAVLLAAAVAAPVLAEYLGPDRVRTTYDTETFSYGVWAHANTGGTLCVPSPGRTDCIMCEWERDPYTASCAYDAGNYYYTLGTRTETVAHSTTNPPATISASLSGCTLVNGWCASPSSLVLTGSEPVSGYTILAIEGTLNGGGLGCSGATCTVPLGEGANAFTYWAFSDWGDTSEMGSTSQGQDTQPPTISGTVDGTTGDNGWYITNAVVSASAADAVSGASLTCSLDGASPAAYTEALTLTDGTHTVVFSAVDGAGHTASASAAANVDTTLPSAGFTSPAAGWLNGTVTVSGTAGDATSGLAQVQLSLNGGSTWQSMGSGSPWSTGWDTTSAGDGTHSLQVYSVDQAGNSISPVSVTVDVDNTPPQLSLSAPGAFCAECGESIDLTYSVQDTGVGVAGWQISVDGTPLISGAAGTGSTFSWDGSGLGTGDHSLVLTGADGLGNSDSIAVTVRLEAEPPAVPPVVIINTSRTATPTATTQTAGGVMGGSGPTPTARPTTSSGSVTFGSVEADGEAAPQAEGSPNLLWGLGALGLIGAVTAAVLEERRKRKEEEARQLAEAQAKAATLNAAEEQKRVENYLRGQLIQQGLNTLRNAGGTAEEIARLRGTVSSNGYTATLAAISQRIGEERTRLVGEQLRNIEETEQRYQEQTRTPNLNGVDADRNGIQDRYQSIINEINEYEQNYLEYSRTPDPNRVDLDRNGIQDRFENTVIRINTTEGFSDNGTIRQDNNDDNMGLWNFQLDFLDSLEDIKGFFARSFFSLRSLIRLTTPRGLGVEEFAPSLSFQDMQSLEIVEEISSDHAGSISINQAVQQFEDIPTSINVNGTDLSDFAENFGKASVALINLTPLALEGASLIVKDSNPELSEDLKNLGETTGGILNLFSGGFELANYANAGQLMQTGIGPAFVIISGVIGVINFVSGSDRLITDETINPLSTEPNSWIERVGVTAETMGSAFMAGAGICAVAGLVSGGAGFAVAAVLAAGGLLLQGVGAIMQNWNEISNFLANL